VKYSLIVQKFFRWGRQGCVGPLSVNLGFPNISATTAARKLKLKMQLDMPKYSFWVFLGIKIFRQGHPGGAGPPNLNLGPF